MERPKVVYWNGMPAPYINDRFNAVARRANLDFEAWFCVRSTASRAWDVAEENWGFRYRFLPGRQIKGMYVNIPTPLIGHRPPDVLVSLYPDPAFIVGSRLAHARGSRIAYWVVKTAEELLQRRRWKEQLKHRLLPAADAILTTGNDGAAFARRYGVQPDRIRILAHSIDVAHYARARSIPEPARQSMREQLGLRGTTFTYVGRIVRAKGLDHLLDAFAVLQVRSEADVSLLLLGNGPDEDRYRAYCHRRGVHNVHFAGFHQKDALPQFYAVSDALVFPTLGEPYGLVVDEAMAAGLPVISTSGAGEIVDRIEDGTNGFIVPPANSAALFDRMDRLARLPAQQRAAMGEVSAQKIASRTPSRWAEEFETAVDAILRQRPAKERS